MICQSTKAYSGIKPKHELYWGDILILKPQRKKHFLRKEGCIFEFYILKKYDKCASQAVTFIAF